MIIWDFCMQGAVVISLVYLRDRLPGNCRSYMERGIGCHVQGITEMDQELGAGSPRQLHCLLYKTFEVRRVHHVEQAHANKR